MSAQLPYARSLSGYLENFLTPTGQRRPAPTAQDRWRPGSPQLHRNSSFTTGQGEGGGALDALSQHGQQNAEKQERKQPNDSQWKKIMVTIAADYARLKEDHSSLKNQCEEQREEVEEMRVRLQELHFNGQDKENQPDRSLLELMHPKGFKQHQPLAPIAPDAQQQRMDEESRQQAAQCLAELVVEEQVKGFFMRQALELQNKEQAQRQELQRLRQALQGWQEEQTNQEAAQASERQRMQECLWAAEAAASRSEAEASRLAARLAEEVRLREAAQGEAQRVKGDQEAHRQQLERVVRDRQLLALKAEDLAGRAVQAQRSYELAAERLERAEQQAEDERDRRAQGQRELGLAQERMGSLQGELEQMRQQQRALQLQLHKSEQESRNLGDKVQQAETEAEILGEDRDRLVNLLRITVEAFQYHEGAIFNLDGMRDLCANLELKLSEQMAAREGTGLQEPVASLFESEDSDWLLKLPLRMSPNDANPCLQMRDLCANLELELSEQMAAREGTGQMEAQASPMGSSQEAKNE